MSDAEQAIAKEVAEEKQEEVAEEPEFEPAYDEIDRLSEVFCTWKNYIPIFKSVLAILRFKMAENS